MIDEKTLNPIPSIGTASWDYTVTNTGAINITIYASVSSELPFKKRYIRAELDKNVQEKTIETPLENVQFVYDQLESTVTYYPLMMYFTLIDETGKSSVSNVTTDSINIHLNGHDRLVSNCFLLLFFTSFIFCNIV